MDKRKAEEATKALRAIAFYDEKIEHIERAIGGLNFTMKAVLGTDVWNVKEAAQNFKGCEGYWENMTDEIRAVIEAKLLGLREKMVEQKMMAEQTLERL